MSCMVSGWAFVLRCFFVLTFSMCQPISFLFSSHFYLYSELHSFFHVDSAKGNNPCASANRGVLPPGIYHPPTGYEPKLLDDFHFSETSEMIFQGGIGRHRYGALVLVWRGTPRWDHQKKALSSPLFIQEREEPADLRQDYHSHEESLLPAQSFFAHTSTVWPVFELSSCRQKPSREMESETIRTLHERQREQILAEVRSEIQKQEFQTESDRRCIQELIGIIESQRREIDHTLASDEQLRRD